MSDGNNHQPLMDRLTARQSTMNAQLREFEHVFIIGLGGIGSWVAILLALSGRVKRLTLWDDDLIEDTNLNRTLFCMKHIGAYKTAAVKELILERRPVDVNIVDDHSVVTHDEKFQEADVKLIVDAISRHGAQNVFVVDCRDNIFKDLHDIPQLQSCKLGYDGTSMTIDMDPSKSHIWGNGRGYQITPSFIVSSNLIAVLAVNEILTIRPKATLKICDKLALPNLSSTSRGGVFRGIHTFDQSDIVPALLHYRATERTLGST